jgi:CHAT domain-containing protein
MLKVPLKPGEAPQQLRDLPNSKTEAENIARDFGTTALTGNQADKNTVIARMQKANIIHLATHGQLDDQQGINSGIVLTNSFLTAKEIINLKLNAELVVLSACDTGQGKLTGDGVIGLSRAFIAAGTPSVIVSLWTVGDESTSYLMQQFYQNRQNSKDNAQALRQAMLTTMKQYPEPSQWAAFTLIGEAK